MVTQPVPPDPGDVDPPGELMENCLVTAIDLVKDDYSAELEATLIFVEERLEALRIETCSW